MKICKRGHEREDSHIRCQTCIEAYKKQYAKDNLLTLRKAAADKYHADPAKFAARMQKYNAKRRDKIAQQNKKYRLENPAVVLANRAKRRAAKLQQTPAWCEDKACEAIYSKCPPGYHVDHIVPLQGKIVSGLHWHHNLQLLPALKNIAKKNKFDPDTYVHELPATIPQ